MFFFTAKLVECSTCFSNFPVEQIVDHADMCASLYVEYDGTTTPEAITVDDNPSDTNDIGLGGNTDGHTFVSLITQP